MSSELKKLFKWFDKKTGHNYISFEFIIGLLKLKVAPKSMQKALSSFKKSNKYVRLNVAVKYMNHLYMTETGAQTKQRMNYRGII
jgi:hypothetical protein